MTTIVLFCVLGGTLVGSTLLWSWFLRWGLRWARVPDVTVRGVAWATVLNIVFQAALLLASSLVTTAASLPPLIQGVAECAGAVLIPCVIVMRVFKASFGQALKAWFLTLAALVIMLPATFLVIRPFLFQAYVCPTNAMAPTLLGRHWQFACPECGSPAFCTPSEGDAGYAGPRSMICRDHFHITSRTADGQKVRGGDRFLVAKFIQPRRWDLAVFRFPEDPSQQYVMRLVGLPGERVMIQDGHISVNGQILTPPERLRGITYQSEHPYSHEVLWGAPESPAQLGDDEYFVLGDFTTQSRDSRWWQQGTPGHHPYAVPASHLDGVATHTYWPPSRWRIFR